MKRDKSSVTAEQMALSRAIETLKCENGICRDRYSLLFLSSTYRLPISVRFSRYLTERVVEKLFPGHHYYVASRTRYFDDRIEAFRPDNGGQLVILGAGYDSRPYRFENLKDAKVFEIDHPATQERKKRILTRHFGRTPGHVKYVSVDFNHEKLSDKLVSSGYDERKTTLFLWEGTTPYLESNAVDDTLGFITANRGKGSELVFDYILHSVLDESCIYEEAKKERIKMSRTSEPYTFGIERDKIAEYLKARKLVLLEDVGDEYFQGEYLKEYPGNKWVKPWWRIAYARIENV